MHAATTAIIGCIGVHRMTQAIFTYYMYKLYSIPGTSALLDIYTRLPKGAQRPRVSDLRCDSVT